MRKFVTPDKAKFIKSNITLLDERLVIKTSKEDGTFTFEPILSTAGLDKSDVALFEKHCKSKGKELLYEVDNKMLKKSKVNMNDVLSYSMLENGTYHYKDTSFEPRTIRLLEHEVKKNIKTSQIEKYKTVVALPSNVDKEALFIPMNKSVINIVGDSIKQRRDALSRLRMGSDLYVYPKDETLLDEFEEYVVEFQEVDNEVFHVKKRTYYFIRDIRGEELEYLSEDEKMLYKKMTRESSEVSIYDQNFFTTNRYELELLLINGFDNMPLKNLIEVYNQEDMNLTKVSLEEVIKTDNSKLFR